MRWHHLAVAVFLCAIGCGDDETTDPLPPSAPGAIRAIVATSGVDQPAGYDIDVDTVAAIHVAPDDTVVVSVAPGEYSVLLRDVPSNCVLDGGENPRVAIVAQGDTTSLFFGVGCVVDMSLRIVFQGYTEDSGFQIYSIRSDGGDPVRHTLSEGWARGPALSPDRRRIAYTMDSGIYVLDILGHAQRYLVAGTVSEFSADGGRILYTAERDIWSMDVDGTSVVRITDTYPEYETHPSWSPDSRQIAYSGLDNQICIISSAGGLAHCVTEGLLQAAYWPNWSPDGSWIVFSGEGEGDSGWRIYTMRPDGGNLVRLTDEGNYDDILADWSPDGSRIAFTRCRNGGTCDIYVVNADGTSLENVTRDLQRDQTDPNW